MKKPVVLCLVLTFVFQLGDSLQCYSCPTGSTQKCEAKEECPRALDSCLKLKHGGNTYSSCVNYDDCDFDRLFLKYPFAQFQFSCCQSDLCNSPSIKERIKNMFG